MMKVHSSKIQKVRSSTAGVISHLKNVRKPKISVSLRVTSFCSKMYQIQIKNNNIIRLMLKEKGNPITP